MRIVINDGNKIVKKAYPCEAHYLLAVHPRFVPKKLQSRQEYSHGIAEIIVKPAVNLWICTCRTDLPLQEQCANYCARKTREGQKNKVTLPYRTNTGLAASTIIAFWTVKRETSEPLTRRLASEAGYSSVTHEQRSGTVLNLQNAEYSR